MLKIILLGYTHEIISNRRIAKACETNIHFMSVSGDIQPLYTCIAGLSLQASNPDNGALTYHWTQTSGVIVNFSQIDNVIWFNDPLKDNKTIISFDVIASDGVLITTTLSQKVMGKENRSGGSINALILLF